MPELPEVETVKRGLQSIVKPSSELREVKLFRKDLRFKIPPSLPRNVKGQKLTSIRRVGKYLLFDFETHSLLNHLGMTGNWRELGNDGSKKHDHFHLKFQNDLVLVYNDPRRFGVLDVAKNSEIMEHKLLRSMGPDPTLDEAFTAEYLKEKARKRIVAVKNFIMDQKIVVGVGNIYASEALFRSGIKPQKQASKVTLKSYETLVKEIKDVLDEAIKAGGSTISDFKQAGGSEGYFQNSFKVYGRKGDPCVTCKEPIQMKVIGQRSSFFCRKCQS